MMSLESLIEQLQRETRDALGAAERGDAVASAEALAQRETTLADLSVRIAASTTGISSHIERTVRSVMRDDAVLRGTLTALRDETRNEIDRVRTARAAARNASPQTEPARFVCERV